MLTPGGLWCGYLGDERTVDFYRVKLPAAGAAEVASRSVDEDTEHRRALWRAEGERAFRASLPPARVGEFIQRAGVERWAADPAFGVVVGEIPSDAGWAAACDAASGLGGTVVARGGAAGDGANIPKSACPNVASTNPVERQIIERLKQAFDPDRRLAPLPWQPR